MGSLQARSARMIQAVLWDFSGVFTGSPFRGLHEYGERIGATGQQLVDWVLGYSLDDCDHAWHRLERGEISFEFAIQSCERAAAESGFQIDRSELLMSFRGGEEGVRQVVVDKVRALRERGYLQAVVTNNIREYSQGWRRLIHADELFDAIVDSCEVGIRKPNPAIYRLALDRLGGVPPDQGVFVDDYEGNVEAARGIGLHGVVVGADVQAALAELDALLAQKTP